MAAPKRLSVVPDVGLRIEIVPKFRGMDHTDVSKTWNFEITNIDELFAPNQVKKIRDAKAQMGVISPTSRVTLPKSIRLLAGIPEEATSFAFMYPIIGLGAIFKDVQMRDSVLFSDSVSNETDDILESSKIDEDGIKSTILLGGFAYFDDDLNCIRINGLSREDRPGKLAVTGPFNVHVPAYEELDKMGRAQSLWLKSFREAGYESFAWVRPCERFAFKPCFDNYPNYSGSFLYFREDRTAVGYAVDGAGFIDYCGDVDMVTEAISRLEDCTFDHDSLRPLFDISIWKKKYDGIVDTEKLIEGLDDKRTLLHKACHAALGADFVNNLLSNSDEASNLLYQDNYGWTPLHYACRFSPKDDALILLLTNACPDSVLQSDYYDRCPIHIACDSNTSAEVLTILLGPDNSTNTLYRKTQKFGFLPLHLACYKGLSNSAIKTLLDADQDGLTVTTKTNCEQLPLHLAILKKVPPNTIKLILDSVSKINEVSQDQDEFAGFSSGFDDVDAGIYDFYQRKLPLHLACWNNSPSETVRLLLERDTENITTTLDIAPVNRAPKGAKNRVSRMSITQEIQDGQFNFSKNKREPGSVQEVVALHLAMKHHSPEVIRLLLQKELETDHYNVEKSALYKIDRRGRNPLHLACEFSSNPIIIQELVNMDTTKRTLQMNDDRGFRPMHYACEQEKPSTEIIQILSETENRFIRRSRLLRKRNGSSPKPRKMSTFAGGREHGRTPLFLALKNGMDAAGIDILMQPGNFTLEGLDDVTMDALAEIAKNNDKAQEKIIDLLVERKIFCLLFLEGYANITALGALMVGSIQLMNGTITKVCPILLIIACVSFSTREILQMISVSEEYISDIWSWSEVACIVFLLKTVVLMFDKIGDPEPVLPVNTLCVTGFLLVLQVITYLRSTLLPFARFVGGLLMILNRLVPFLIVSILLVGAFIYSYYVTGQEGCDTFTNCSKIMIQSTYNFGPGATAPPLDFVFGIVISIVILNVVIAIVSEAWDDAATQSTMFFWRYRLEKIQEFKGLDKVKFKLPTFKVLDNALRWIDEMENISFQNEIAWSVPPYDNVTSLAQYNNPQDFFDASVTRKILEAKALESDLFFGDLHARGANGVGLTFKEKTKIICRWLFRCVIYFFVVIAGFLTGGYLFPKNFRSGLLSYGVEEDAGTDGSQAVTETTNPLELVAKKANINRLNVEEVKRSVDMAEQVVLKRNNLRSAGVSEEDINLAIPITMVRYQSGILEDA